jgi:hypothetical protein
VNPILDRDHVDRKLLYLHSFGLLDFFKSFASLKNKSYAHIYMTPMYTKVLIGEVVMITRSPCHRFIYNRTYSKDIF